MSEHLVAYVNWQRIIAWKILSLSISETELVPFAYGSKQPIFKKYAKKNNVIWIFSIPMVDVPRKSAAYKYRPTLVAKISIDSVVKDRSQLKKHENKKEIEKLIRLWDNVAIANPEKSRFFELNDATSLLLDLSFESRSGETRIANPFDKMPCKNEINKTQALRSHIAKNYRFIKRIFSKNTKNVRRLKQFESQTKKRSVFISYAYADGRSYPLALADQMLSSGWSPWIDTLVIPSRKKRKKQDTIPPNRLQKLLQFGIMGSPLFVALVSDNYVRKDSEKKTKWTLKELEFARKQKEIGRLQNMVQIKIDDKELLGFDKTISKVNEELMVVQISNWLQNRNM
jgi:hypothetical protein